MNKLFWLVLLWPMAVFSQYCKVGEAFYLSSDKRCWVPVDEAEKAAHIAKYGAKQTPDEVSAILKGDIFAGNDSNPSPGVIANYSQKKRQEMANFCSDADMMQTLASHCVVEYKVYGEPKDDCRKLFSKRTSFDQRMKSFFPDGNASEEIIKQSGINSFHARICVYYLVQYRSNSQTVSNY